MGKTPFPLVVKILPKLEVAGPEIPLWLKAGWVASESGGRLADAPPVLPGQTEPERGLFQLHPDESKSLGVDHARLSTDVDYSIDAGIKLIRKYMAQVETKIGIGQTHPLYWYMVKFFHTIGSGAAPKLWSDMQSNGLHPNTWGEVVDYSKKNESRLFSLLKHSPTKWTGMVTDVEKKGKILAVAEHVKDIVVKAATDPKTGIPIAALFIAGGAAFFLLRKRG